VRAALALASVSIRRQLRDRRAVLFLVVLPVLLIVILGNSFSGFSKSHVGVVDLGAGAAGARIEHSLARDGDLVVTRYRSVAAADVAVARSEVQVVVVLPRGMTAALARAHPQRVRLVSEDANGSQQQAVEVTESAISEAAADLQAAQFAAAVTHSAFGGDLSLATSLRAEVERVPVEVHAVDSAMTTLPLGFSDSAPTMLVLFVFISAMSGGAMVVEVRRLRIYERMGAAPVGPRTIVAGEFLALLAVALLQSALIVTVGAVLFDVSWGSPPAAAALVVAWACVAAGAGMLGGTLFVTPEQGTALGPAIGIVFGMLGGCMWPLAIVSTPLRELGHATPQAWAVDAWTSLLSRGATLADVLPELGILAGVALGLLGLAAWRLTPDVLATSPVGHHHE
jgi:linearmycin/streptolysin S transport system permease protein